MIFRCCVLCVAGAVGHAPPQSHKLTLAAHWLALWLNVYVHNTFNSSLVPGDLVSCRERDWPRFLGYLVDLCEEELIKYLSSLDIEESERCVVALSEWGRSLPASGCFTQQLSYRVDIQSEADHSTLNNVEVMIQSVRTFTSYWQVLAHFNPDKVLIQKDHRAITEAR